MPVYPINPQAGAIVGRNLCTRPAFPDVSRGAWTMGTVESREMHDYINGPDQPPGPTGIWHNRLGGFAYNMIRLPGVIIGQSPPPINGSWEPYTHFKITWKIAMSPSAGGACGVIGAVTGSAPGEDDYGFADEIPPGQTSQGADGVYTWCIAYRSLYEPTDNTGGGWREKIGEPVDFYVQTSLNQFGIHYFRIDWADSTVPDYFDGDTPDNAFENYAWDGTPFKSASLASLVAVRDVAPPSAPLGLVSTGSTTTTIDLDWQTAADNVGVVGYDVWEYFPLTSTTSPQKVNRTGPILQTAYTVTETFTPNYPNMIPGAPLQPNTAHFYYVIARDAAGNQSLHSATVEGITKSSDVTPPQPPPAAPTASGTTHNSTNLNWVPGSDNVGVTGYNVWVWAVGIDSAWRKITTAPVPDTFYTATGLTPSTGHDFAITSVDAAGLESSRSATSARVTTLAPPPPDETPPSTPTSLVVTGQTHDTASLDWNAATDNVGVTGYNVYAGPTKLNVAPVTQTLYTATGLTPETVYTFTVTALDEAGNESAHSVSATTTTGVAPPPPDVTPPTPPAELFADTASATAVNLGWWPSSDDRNVAGYYVYIGDLKLVTTPIVDIAYTVTGLLPATVYTFTVTAVDDAGNESTHSPTAVARTNADDSPWGIHDGLAATLAPRIAAYVRKPGHADTIAAAKEYVPVVTEYIRGYTRNRGFPLGVPAGPLQVVIVAAAARLVTNPEQLTYYATGDYTERPAVLTGYTLAELGVLRRYRRIVG